jgi:hypothetical protein
LSLKLAKDIRNHCKMWSKTALWLLASNVISFSNAIPSTTNQPADPFLFHKRAAQAPAKGFLPPDLIAQLTAPIENLAYTKYSKEDSDIRPGAKKVRVSYGPFKIPPSKAGAMTGHGGHGDITKATPGKPMDPNGYQIRNLLVNGFCNDCTILRARALVTDEAGASMGIGSGVYLHHVIVSPLDQKSIPDPWGVCEGVKLQLPKLPPGVKIPNLNSFLIVQGVENFTTWYTTKDGNFDSGYQIPKTERSALNVLTGEFVNYGKDIAKVYVTMEYDYVDGIKGGDAFMSLLSVLGKNFIFIHSKLFILSNELTRQGCSLTAGPSAAGLGFRVNPSGVESKSSRNFTIQFPGTIINARAHMHDGGSALKLFINEQLECESFARYGGTEQSQMVSADGKKWETISSMSECEKPLKVKKGDKLRMVADFDTVKHPLRSSGEMDAEEMGIYFMTFVPDDKH